jgi:hypothetical protein
LKVYLQDLAATGWGQRRLCQMMLKKSCGPHAPLSLDSSLGSVGEHRTGRWGWRAGLLGGMEGFPCSKPPSSPVLSSQVFKKGNLERGSILAKVTQ